MSGADRRAPDPEGTTVSDIPDLAATAAPSGAEPGHDAPDPDRWRALFVIGISALMVVLDASIVNLALPSAKRDLGISDADQQWVITAYTLAFGGLLLLGGRIADYVGRKKIFIVGLVGFAFASALGGLATGPTLLFLARGLQGAFAALLAPAALSLITVTFHEPKERARAFGVYGAISGGGAAVGLLLGGVLTEYFSWRWCLFVNVPIAIVAAVLATRYVHESKATGAARYDVAGAITATLGLGALVYAFTKAAPHGFQDTSHWTDTDTIAWFVGAAILLVSFFVIESRAVSPLLPLRILRDRNRGTSYAVNLIVGIGMFAMFLFLGLWLQVVKGMTPVVAGFAFLPFSLGIIVGAGIASQLLPKVGPKPLMVPGLVGAALSLLWLSTLEYDSNYWTHVFPAMLVMSVSMAHVFIPVSTTALHGIGREDAGVGSAVLNTTQQVGGSIGTALLNTIAVAATTAWFVANPGQPTDETTKIALTEGYTHAFAWGAGFLALAAVVTLVFLKIGKDAAAEDDAETVVHIG
ncbi:MAG: MFS transporter [Candidatus Nanopelagicales bacterium]